MNVPSQYEVGRAAEKSSQRSQNKSAEKWYPQTHRPMSPRRARRRAVRVVGVMMILMLAGYLVYATYPQWGGYAAGLQNGNVNSVPSTPPTNTQPSPVTVVSTGTPASITGGAPIDPIWIAQFIADVNNARQQQGLGPLTADASLNSFAAKRFTTASSNYQISHYGFDSDMSCFFINCIPLSELSGPNYVFNQAALNSMLNQGAYYQLPSGFSGPYWELNFVNSPSTVYFTTESAISAYFTATYGSYTSVTFSGGSFLVTFPQVGEVIFYPSQFTPQAYLSYVKTSAPLHWQLLDSSSLSHYGYYVGTGPVVSVNSGCPVTEIPGPNINVTQYFQIQGCQTTVTNGYWLVIDLSG